MTELNAALRDNFEAGLAWARGLKAGDIFRGSHGEARHLGLDEEATCYFGAGAQCGLSDLIIYCNDTGAITNIKRKGE